MQYSIDGIHNIQQLHNFIERYNISRGDVCLVGSAPLAIRGLRENSDIDIFLRNDLEEEYDRTEFSELSIQSRKFTHLSISDDSIFNNEKYFDEVAGFKVIRPEIIYSHKKLKGRKKDYNDIELLDQYRKETGDWYPELVINEVSHSIPELVKRGVISIKKNGLRHTVFTGIPAYIRFFNPLKGVTNYYSEPTSILGKTYRSYRADGFRKTLGRGIRLIKLIEPTGLLDRYSRIRHKAKLGTLVERELDLSYSVGKLLNKQYNKDDFTRYDLVVRLLVVESMQKGSDVPAVVEHFEGHSEENVRKRIEEYVEFNSTSGLVPTPQIGYNGEIVEPNKLATALSVDPKHVSITVQSGSTTDSYPIDWFENNGFCTEEIQQIETRFSKLLYDSGALFVFVLWPPAEPYFDDIVEFIDGRAPVHFTREFTLSETTFEDLVWDLYKSQPSKLKYIDNKVEEMSEYSKNVLVGCVEIPHPRIREGKSHTMNELKERVRKEFTGKVLPKNPNENIMMHSTDNIRHNCETLIHIEKRCGEITTSEN